MRVSRNCIECGHRLHGRSDKKFCSDMCRNSFHNRENSESNSFMRRINMSLKRNRKILEELCNNQLDSVNRNQLQDLGFSFRHFTGSERTDKGIRYYCYEYAYSYLNKSEIALTRLQQD